MSAQPHDATDAAVAVVECPPCGLEFAPASSQDEAKHLAAVHNGLHHGGTPSAVIGDSHHAGSPAAPEAGSPVLQLGWVLDPALLEDALAQAIPFTGDETATDRAWSARVDSAVQGMDVLDPGGVDVWAEAHAQSAEPHLAEAELVAVWETWIRTEYATDCTTMVSGLPRAGKSLSMACHDLDAPSPSPTTATADWAAEDAAEADGWAL